MCVLFWRVNMNIERVQILTNQWETSACASASFLPTKEAQRQGRIRACRGESYLNIYLLKLTMIWWSSVSFSQIILSPCFQI